VHNQEGCLGWITVPTKEETVLQVTENAAAALESIRQMEGIPESHGTRLTGGPQPDGDIAVRLEFVESPVETDQVTKQGETEVYVDPEVAQPLAEAVMDVQDSEEGLAFVFRPQMPQQ
jgi:Fe-S cluster assembly iron-binding protein IscA